jgi:hypothetical protein
MAKETLGARLVRIARALVFIFYALGSLLFYAPLLLLIPQLSLMFINYSVYRRYIDFLVGGWCDFMGGLVEIVLDCRIVLTGDNLTKKYARLPRQGSLIYLLIIFSHLLVRLDRLWIAW